MANERLPRTILIVERKFQYLFIAKNLLLLFTAFLLVFGMIKVWDRYQTKQGFLLRIPKNAEVVAWAKANNVEVDSAEFYRQFLVAAKVHTVFDLMWRPLTGILLLNILIVIIASLYYSHRIVGPVYRIKMDLEKRMNGEEMGPIKIRKGDHFQDLVDILNKTLSQEKIT